MVDMPAVPPQYAQVMIVQASQAQRSAGKLDRTIGVCSLVENPIRMEGEQYSAINGITPVSAVQVYYQNTENLLGPGSVTVWRTVFMRTKSFVRRESSGKSPSTPTTRTAA